LSLLFARIDVAQNQTAHSSRWVEMCLTFGLAEKCFDRQKCILCASSPSIKILSDLRQIRLSMPREVRIAFDPASGKIAIRDAQYS
ncbi:hypothetical protein KCU92_g174, partial [Aureobasidium melanogenum]